MDFLKYKSLMTSTLLYIFTESCRTSLTIQAIYSTVLDIVIFIHYFTLCFVYFFSVPFCQVTHLCLHELKKGIDIQLHFYVSLSPLYLLPPFYYTRLNNYHRLHNYSISTLRISNTMHSKVDTNASRQSFSYITFITSPSSEYS